MSLLDQVNSKYKPPSNKEHLHAVCLVRNPRFNQVMKKYTKILFVEDNLLYRNKLVISTIGDINALPLFHCSIIFYSWVVLMLCCR